MKLIGVIFLLSIMMVSLVSAGELGQPVKQNGVVDLVQTCSNCTYVNLTSITYPNGTQEIIGVDMVRTGEDYKFSWGNTSQIGTYKYHTCGDLTHASSNTRIVTCETITFEVTYGGNNSDSPSSILYLAILGINIFLFLLVVYSIPKLPQGDNRDEDNKIISINWLKYLRPVGWGIAWLLLLSLMFVVSNISLAYLSAPLVGKLFFVIYQIMFYMTLPMILIWIIWLIYRAVMDNRMMEMIERGVDMSAI